MFLRAIIIGAVLLFGGLVQGREMCGFYNEFSDLENHVSAGSPFIEDCRQMLEDIGYTDNQWSVDAVGHHTLADHNTCAVGVELYYPWDYIIWVGNVDIKYMVNMSIDEYGTDGRVGTKGYMRCKRTVYTEAGPTGVAVFSIYFNPKYSETQDSLGWRV